MSKNKVKLLPETLEYLKIMGQNIKIARLRRDISMELVASRAGINRTTVSKAEKGNSSVSLGIYAAILHALNGLDKDLLLIAKEDNLGRQIQDINLQLKKRASRK